MPYFNPANATQRPAQGIPGPGPAPARVISPAANMQRNNITSALMNIAAPQPRTQMPQMPPSPMQAPMARPGTPASGMPPGVMPQGTMPQGTMPPGAMPPGAMPPQGVPGQMPQGGMPGQVPNPMQAAGAMPPQGAQGAAPQPVGPPQSTMQGL